MRVTDSGFSRAAPVTWAARFFLLAVLCLPGLAAAQAYEGTACTAKGNAALKGLKPGASVPSFSDGLTGDYSPWATSTLLPKGKAPECKDCEPADDDSLNTRTQFQHEWTCTYSAQRVSDGKPDTAWCEGAKGPGEGEVVVAPVEPGRPVRIRAGFGKSAQLHAANARPRKVRVSVLQAKVRAAHQVGTQFGGLTVAATGEVELADVNGEQDLKLPAYKADPEAVATFVAIEVLSVYPGAKFQDLCISEVSSP